MSVINVALSSEWYSKLLQICISIYWFEIKTGANRIVPVVCVPTNILVILSLSLFLLRSTSFLLSTPSLYLFSLFRLTLDWLRRSCCGRFYLQRPLWVVRNTHAYSDVRTNVYAQTHGHTQCLCGVRGKRHRSDVLDGSGWTVDEAIVQREKGMHVGVCVCGWYTHCLSRMN
jgi:hypothetical protein